MPRLDQDSRAQGYDLISLRRRLVQKIASITLHSDSIVSFTADVPGFAAFPGNMGVKHVYWADQQRAVTRLGMGRVATMQIYGRHRFDSLQKQWDSLLGRWLRIGLENAEQNAIAVLGFSFLAYDEAPVDWGGMPSMLCYVPEVVFESTPDTTTLTFTANVEALNDPEACCDRWIDIAEQMTAASNGSDVGNVSSLPPASTESQQQWLERATRALQEIEQGHFEKIVLSRQLRITTEHQLNRPRILHRIARNADQGITFALGDSRASLVGVSPERLVSLNNGHVVCDAVAATVLASDSTRLDMLHDPKMMAEHDLVVKHIESRLSDCCEEIRTPVQPRALRIHDLLHLWSPITGRARNGIDLPGLARRLHPTPAVGGLPVAAAQDWLAHHDAQARGWYSGALGWLRPDGDGELAVVLRCGLINGSQADLFAGAGLVAGSDPHDELTETNWKFQPMLHAIAPD